MDSNSEDSDSDMSDVPEVDSDLEAEKQMTYERAVYKEDMAVIKQQRKLEMAPGEKRARAPDEGLKLEFVHGYVVFFSHGLKLFHFDILCCNCLFRLSLNNELHEECAVKYICKL